jgi:structural maintenance of chromosome 2
MPTTEQIERDIISARKSIEDAHKAANKLQKECDSVVKELKGVEVSHSQGFLIGLIINHLAIQERHSQAVAKLREERATLTRFDDEINDLEEVIKQKEQAISDIELSIKKAEHDMQSLQKNKTSTVNAINTLEKAYEWIADEKK